MPGTVLMFAIGALIATDALAFLPTVVMAALGAVVGDGISFWLGRHYHQQLRVIWPFRRYPALINNGVDFFTRHGGKSVLFARFVGPVRPILPAIAGMLDMPAIRFLSVNVFSAILWAPAYLLPGVVFGTSLNLATEVAGRLALLLLILVGLLWLIGWSMHRLFNRFSPHAGALIYRLLAWGRRHPLFNPLLGALLDPAHPEARGLAVLVILFGIACLGLALLLTLSLTGIDHWLHVTLSALRTPLTDQVLLIITQLGNGWVLGATTLVVSLWLLHTRHWRALAHGLAAMLASLLLVQLMKLGFAVERPVNIYDGNGQFAFPSSHTAMALTAFGFWAVLITRELPEQRRWLPYSLAALVVTLTGFSRIYLGAHWLSDVLGGIAVGLGSVALFGIAYRRHPARPLPWRGFTLLAFITLAAGTATQVWRGQDQALVHKAPDEAVMAIDRWWQQGWQELPAWRLDLANSHHQPLNLQYAGTLETFAQILENQGWSRAPFPAWRESLRWLSPDASLTSLPLLPHVHDGKHEQARWTQLAADGKSLWVIRLWPTAVNDQLWIGAISEVRLTHQFGLLHYLHTTQAFDQALAHFLQKCCPGLITQAVEPTKAQPYRRLLLMSTTNHPLDEQANLPRHRSQGCARYAHQMSHAAPQRDRPHTAQGSVLPDYS
jgi:undecaprenyl-diphosphatase